MPVEVCDARQTEKERANEKEIERSENVCVRERLRERESVCVFVHHKIDMYVEADIFLHGYLHTYMNTGLGRR